MFEYLFFPVFFLIIATSCGCIYFWLFGKYVRAFYINLFNIMGFLYLSIVILILGNSGLFPFKVIIVCFTIFSLACSWHLYVEMKKEKAGYQEINNYESDNERISPLLIVPV